MHAATIVARVLDCCLSGLHAKRAAACQRAVVAVVMGAALSLSAIAARMGAQSAYRHRIKSVDRLLGNAALHAVRQRLYAALAAHWLSGIGQLLIVIDWSDLTADQKWQWLRASVAVEGRSVTLYEEAHPRRRLNNPRVHRQFLMRLAALLPAGCVPIVMTDAGFQAPWFKAVAARGWVFIGRIRGRQLVQREHQPWQRASALYSAATAKPRKLGVHRYVRSNAITIGLVLVKRPAHQRHRLNIYGRRRASRSSTNCARSAREPWLLALAPELDHLSAEAIVQLYAQRMRIEQSFRDTKNLRLGQGLHTARSRSAERLQMLLLIGHLAAFVQRLIGEAAKAHQLELQFMATTRKHRAEISVLTLARRILASSSPPRWLQRLSPWTAIAALRQQAISACAVT
jgi:DDE family transposase